MPATKKSTRKKRTSAPLKIRSMNLTPDDAGLLASLAQEATDQLGQSISTSAVLRAILYCIRKQRLPEPAVLETIEEGVQAGRMWGTLRR